MVSRSPRSQVEPAPENPDLRPLLGESQLTTLQRYGSQHHVVDGDILFADGDKTYDLIVVLEGGIEIVEHHGQPDEVVIITYGPREFIGEMGLLTGQSVYLSAVATSEGRVLRISAAQVKAIMSEEADLSELILRAFLLRHSRLTNLGSGPVLVGSRFDADTRRLLEVFARNRLSSRWMELEGSPEAESLLREIDVPIDELPIVILPGGSLLRNPTSLALLDALGLAEAPVEDRSEVCDLLVAGVGGQLDSPRLSTARRRGCRQRLPRTPRLEAKLAPPLGSRTISAFRLDSPAKSSRREQSCKHRSSGFA
jgi:thioredoxin reductase (NADPH)